MTKDKEIQDKAFLQLSKIDSGIVVILSHFEGGASFKERISHMGLKIDSEIKIISSGGSLGRILIQVGETRLALGHGMSNKIFVKRKKL
ncbi:MAG: FeoA family protein [Verrucomicrobiota bacterium]|nr:FeoA family protein [Verrucomicrobiota bacterium]